MLWETFNITTSIIIFIAYGIIDAMYIYYTYSVVHKQPLASATSGLIIHILLAIGIINYIENTLYIIPLALGSWCGTYIMVAREKD